MKKIIAILLVAASLSGCTSSNQFGECIGVFDDGAPGVRYTTSGWNVAMAIIFSETIIVPAVVIASEIKCPTNFPKE